MKTNKETATATFTFDFAPVKEALVMHYNSGVNLGNILTSIWNSAPQHKRVVAVFRREFMEFATRLGYGETWIKRTLASVEELRVRAKRSDAGKERPGKPVVKKFTIDELASAMSAAGLDKAKAKAVLTILASK